MTEAKNDLAMNTENEFSVKDSQDMVPDAIKFRPKINSIIGDHNTLQQTNTLSPKNDSNNTNSVKSKSKRRANISISH